MPLKRVGAWPCRDPCLLQSPRRHRHRDPMHRGRHMGMLWCGSTAAAHERHPPCNLTCCPVDACAPQDIAWPPDTCCGSDAAHLCGNNCRRNCPVLQPPSTSGSLPGRQHGMRHFVLPPSMKPAHTLQCSPAAIPAWFQPTIMPQPPQLQTHTHVAVLTASVPTDATQPCGTDRCDTNTSGTAASSTCSAPC
jgi:hypothetical protein